MPIDKATQLSTNCVTTNATCVIWNLDPIPCLNIKTGDRLSDIVFAIVAKICKNIPDVSDVDLRCLVEKYAVSEPRDKTVNTILQLLVTNQCNIKDLLGTDSGGNPTTTLTLDLKCLKETDSYGNQIPYTQQSVLQKLINESCIHRDQIIALQQAGSNTGTGASYVEPTLDLGCLGSKQTSQGLALLASDYCTWKAKVGTAEDISKSMALQCSGIRDLFKTNDSFIQSPQNLAQDEGNQWILLCNLLDRIKTLEGCACKAKCSDLKLGFLPILDQNGIKLDFGTQYGTNIDPQWKINPDGNNSVTFSDANGITRPFPVTELENGTVLGPYDISTLDTSRAITINICLGFKTDDGQFCNKCATQTYLQSSSGSAPCTLKAVGSEVTILYKECVSACNCNYSSLVIKDGTTAFLSKTQKPIYISNTDALNGIECLDTSELQDTNCYVSMIDSDIDNTRTIVGIKLGDKTYNFQNPYAKANGVYNVSAIAAEVKSLIPSIIDANGSSGVSSTSYYWEPNPVAWFFGIGPGAKKITVNLSYYSFIQIKTLEGIAKTFDFVYRSSNVEGDSITLGPVLPRSTFEGANDVDSILPISLC